MGSVTGLVWVAPTLSDAGLSPADVATAMLLLPVIKLIGSPLWSWAADRRETRLVLVLSSALAAGFGLAFAGAPSAPWLIAAMIGMAISRAGLFPVADAMTLALLGDDRRSYGQIRAVGSVVFAVVIFADGSLREVWPRGPLWIAAILVGCSAVISLTLPTPERLGPRPGMAEVLTAARDPVLASLLAIGVLHGLTITTYDSLFSLHIEMLGLPGRVTGAAFALGVVVEVIVLWNGRALLERFGPLPLLTLAVLSGVPRWLLTGSTDQPAVLIAAQGLHGLGFGAYWVAGVALFNERAPASLGSTALALFTVGTFGAGYLCSMAVAAWVLSTHDTSALYLGMAGVSAVAAALTAAPWFLTGQGSRYPSQS